jgi:Cof subfamily protein (haloacid dehalogenase superfamily)
MTHPITTIATDLDGTLLTSNHEISPRTERALRQAMARGVQVILATGKTAGSRERPVRQLGLTTPGVYSQGLVLLNGDGSVRERRDLDPDIARTTIQYAEACGCNIVVVAEGGARVLSNRASTLTAFMVAHHEPEPELINPLSTIADTTPITKLLIEAEPGRIPDIRAALHAHLNGAATLVQSMPQLLEILPPGASKGDGLRRLLAGEGIDPRHVLALGDAENDIEMLQLAGIGVAMGNAPQDVKDAADYVTASNDEDGVALAVERFVLGC